jgi:hypothetical protein
MLGLRGDTHEKKCSGEESGSHSTVIARSIATKQSSFRRWIAARLRRSQ